MVSVGLLVRPLPVRGLWVLTFEELRLYCSSEPPGVAEDLRGVAEERIGKVDLVADVVVTSFYA
jgi:hypothetical protein